MIIYNVTLNIENDILESWKIWIRKHIKEVLETGKFEKAILSKVLSSDEGHTFSIQYYSKSRDELNEYFELYAPKLREYTYKTFGNRVIGFRTELEILDIFN